MNMKLRKLVNINENSFDDFDEAPGQTRSQREMQELTNFIYERINKITKQQRQNNNNEIHLEFDFDASFNSVFNEDPDDTDIITFRVVWGSVDDIWEIVSYFCISSPIFHQDQLDDFNVEVSSFYINVDSRHEILIDYDPLGFLDRWSEILSTEIFQNMRRSSYVFRLPDQEQLKRNAKDALQRVKDQYD